MDTQLRKGAIELCVLALLEKEEMYGYQLVQELSEVMPMTEGTIYPLLRRLKSDSLISSKLKESPDGPARKYYSLTSKGSTHLKEQKAAWKLFTKQMEKILK